MNTRVSIKEACRNFWVLVLSIVVVVGVIIGIVARENIITPAFIQAHNLRVEQLEKRVKDLENLHYHE